MFEMFKEYLSESFLKKLENLPNERHFIFNDKQGGSFGGDRVYTTKEWVEQAIEWLDMDEHYLEQDWLVENDEDKIIENIADYWELEPIEMEKAKKVNGITIWVSKDNGEAMAITKHTNTLVANAHLMSTMEEEFKSKVNDCSFLTKREKMAILRSCNTNKLKRRKHMKKTIILNKSDVKSSYRYWDSYRYSDYQNWENAIKQYCDHKSIWINRDPDFTIFKSTIHIHVDYDCD